MQNPVPATFCQAKSSRPVKNKPFLSTDEAAERLGLSRAWVARLVKAGVLEGYALNGRAIAVLASSVEKNFREYSRLANKPKRGRPRKID